MSDTRITRKTRSKSPKKRHQVAADEVLRARPIKGEIDYAELSREHLARYPKIRAALAK
jgi:hypothetical protein